MFGGGVGLRAQLGFLLGAAALCAGLALGGGLRAVGFGDPHPGVALDLVDLVRGGFGVGDGAGDLRGAVQDGAELALLGVEGLLGVRGDVAELGQ